MTLLFLAVAYGAEFRSPDEVLATFDAEPPVREVQEMALAYSKTDPHYVDAWLKASQSTVLLPEVKAGYGYSQGLGNDYDYIILDATAAPVSQISGAAVDYDHGFSVSAKWRFDKLIMSSERIRVISESQDIVKLRDNVLEDVTRLYFDRRRLQVDMLLNSGDMKAQLKNELRLAELTAELDAYTGGRFSAALPKK